MIDLASSIHIYFYLDGWNVIMCIINTRICAQVQSYRSIMDANYSVIVWDSGGVVSSCTYSPEKSPFMDFREPRRLRKGDSLPPRTLDIGSSGGSSSLRDLFLVETVCGALIMLLYGSGKKGPT